MSHADWYLFRPAYRKIIEHGDVYFMIHAQRESSSDGNGVWGGWVGCYLNDYNKALFQIHSDARHDPLPKGFSRGDFEKIAMRRAMAEFERLRANDVRMNSA